MPRQRRTAGTIIAAALCLLLAPAAAHAEHLRLILDWFVNPDHAPILVAQQIGAYAAEGLDVELVAPTDATLGPKLVAAGQGDIALTAEPQFIEQHAAGLHLVRIGALIARPLSTLLVRRDSGITRLQDLRGRRIGYGSGEVERLMVATMLQHAGLAATDVSMVQIGEQLSVALLSRQIDAVSVYRNVEPLEMAAHGTPTTGFDYEAYGVPPFDDLILVARSAADADPRLSRFLRATNRGLAYLHAHPAESWALVSKAHPELDDALGRACWAATLPYFTDDATRADPAGYARFAAFLHEHGL